MGYQTCCEISVLGDVQNLTGQGPQQPDFEVSPSLRRGLNEMSFRVPHSVDY